MTEISNMNEKYTQLCSEKCKLLNSIESSLKESRNIKKEICTILDLIGEAQTDEDLLKLESESESEMTTNDPFYESFLNSSAKKCELEKVKKIHSEIHENLKRIERKPKRKSPTKKLKISSDNEHGKIIEESEEALINLTAT